MREPCISELPKRDSLSHAWNLSGFPFCHIFPAEESSLLLCHLTGPNWITPATLPISKSNLNYICKSLLLCNVTYSQVHNIITDWGIAMHLFCLPQWHDVRAGYLGLRQPPWGHEVGSWRGYSIDWGYRTDGRISLIHKISLGHLIKQWLWFLSLWARSHFFLQMNASYLIPCPVAIGNVYWNCLSCDQKTLLI